MPYIAAFDTLRIPRFAAKTPLAELIAFVVNSCSSLSSGILPFSLSKKDTYWSTDSLRLWRASIPASKPDVLARNIPVDAASPTFLPKTARYCSLMTCLPADAPNASSIFPSTFGVFFTACLSVVCVAKFPRFLALNFASDPPRDEPAVAIPIATSGSAAPARNAIASPKSFAQKFAVPRLRRKPIDFSSSE